MNNNNTKVEISILFIGNRPSDIAQIKGYLEKSEELIYHIEHRPDFFGSSDLLAGDKVIDVILLDLGIFAAGHAEETFQRMIGMARGIPIIVFTDRKDHNLALKAIKDGAADNITRSDLETNSNKFRDTIEFSIARAEVALNLEMRHTQSTTEALARAREDMREAQNKSETAMDRQKDRYTALVRKVIDRGDDDILLAVRQVRDALEDSKFENSILLARLKSHETPNVVPLK